MGIVRKSITVTDQQDEWIKAQIASGNYGSDSEVLRDLIRRRQNEEAQIEEIRAALIKAEQSGFTTNTPENIRQEVLAQMRKDGEL